MIPTHLPDRPTLGGSFPHLIALLLLLTAPPPGDASPESWNQFGGPDRSFRVETNLPDTAWEDRGPARLWESELGPGYSGLVTDEHGTTIFGHTRRGDDELIIAFDATGGAKLWEVIYSAPTRNLRGVDMSYGNAPQSTPLYANGRLHTLGFTGILTTVDAASGEILWSLDLGEELGVRIPYFGHAASPILIPPTSEGAGPGSTDPNPVGAEPTLLVLAGGALALDPRTGEVHWHNRTFGASYASPILAETAFGPQLIAPGAGVFVGIDPGSGESLWRHEWANEHRTIISTPVLVEDDLLFVSVYFEGSRGLRLVARDRVEVVWEQPDVQASQFNVVLAPSTPDDPDSGSSRSSSMIVTTFRRNLFALDPQSGEILWRRDRFGAANLILTGHEAFVLGGRGRLSTILLGSEPPEHRRQARVLGSRAWTAPILLDDDRAFVRDQSVVVALDLTRVDEAREPPSLTAPENAPAELAARIGRLETDALTGDIEAVEQTLDRLDDRTEDELLAPWIAYHRAAACWLISLIAEPEDRELVWVDRALAAAGRAVELEPRHGEAHALLANLYQSLHRLDPDRARVVGPLGDEHLDRALTLAGDSPRIRLLQAVDLAISPRRWGGDPERAEGILRSLVASPDRDTRVATKDATDTSNTNRTDHEPERSGSLEPGWHRSLAPAYLAGLLLATEEGDHRAHGEHSATNDHEEARRLLAEARRKQPGLALADRLEKHLTD